MKSGLGMERFGFLILMQSEKIGVTCVKIIELYLDKMRYYSDLKRDFNKLILITNHLK
jgi:hypothetical protein